MVDNNMVEWWCTSSDDYGYGIFHREQWDLVVGKYVMVSLDIIDIVTATNYYLKFLFPGWSI